MKDLIIIPEDYKAAKRATPEIIKKLRQSIGNPIMIRPSHTGPNYKDIHDTRIRIATLEAVHCKRGSYGPGEAYVDWYMDLSDNQDLYYGHQKVGEIELPPLFIPYNHSSCMVKNMSSKIIGIGIPGMIKLLKREPRELYSQHIAWLERMLEK